MVQSKIKVEFEISLDKVWNMVTSLENFSWRSDLSKIEVIEVRKKFVEYTKDGYATTFTITHFEPMKRYEFDMNNENMSGHWIGLFQCDNGKTVIDFTENVSAKKLIMKPFVGMYLKKQQATYIADLKKALAI